MFEISDRCKLVDPGLAKAEDLQIVDPSFRVGATSDYSEVDEVHQKRKQALNLVLAPPELPSRRLHLQLLFF